MMNNLNFFLVSDFIFSDFKTPKTVKVVKMIVWVKLKAFVINLSLHHNEKHISLVHMEVRQVQMHLVGRQS